MFDSARVRGVLRCYDAIDRVMHHAGIFLSKSAHEQDECAADVTNQRGRPDQVRAYRRRHTIVHGYMHSTKKKKKKKKKERKKDGEIDSASLDVPLLFCSLIATSKTLQSLLHSLKTTIDEVLGNAVVCLVCQIARRNGALKLEVIDERAVPTSANSTSKSKCSPPVIQPRTKKPFLAAFTTVFSCV